LWTSLKKWVIGGFHSCTKKITEYGLAIVRIHNENIKCIGHNWAQQFVQRFEDQIGAKTCALLEKTRASALNPENVRHHFDLLSKTIQSYGIHPRNIYNCDETGCPLNVPLRQKVVVSATSGQGRAVSSASKEHITVLEFICADGTALQPVVIFPGKAFLQRWKQVNPLNAKWVTFWATGKLTV
jgi:hypothetical protein